MNIRNNVQTLSQKHHTKMVRHCQQKHQKNVQTLSVKQSLQVVFDEHALAKAFVVGFFVKPVSFLGSWSRSVWT